MPVFRQVQGLRPSSGSHRGACTQPLGAPAAGGTGRHGAARPMVGAMVAIWESKWLIMVNSGY